MARGEHEDYDRQPRWNTAGYWTSRREGEDWQGDPSHSRNYNREDMRRYGRRSVDQGRELRNLRGQEHEPWDAQLDTDQIGIHDEHALDFDRDRGRDWGYDRDYGTNRRQRERTRQQNELARQQNERSRQDPGQQNQPRQQIMPRQQDQRPRQQNQPRGGQDRDRYAQGMTRGRGGRPNDDFDYDAERDYRNNKNIGRDLNLEGSGDPGRWERDPYRNRDYNRENYSRGYDPDRSNWNEGDRGDDPWGDNGPRVFRRDSTDYDTYDNFWGEREQGRQFGNRAQGDWWNNAGGRGDVTSARRSDENNLPQGVNYEDWDDDRDWDMDPGYDYEFGTDFNFMNDVNLEQARGQRGRGDRGSWENRGGQQGAIYGEMEYGWQGAPYRQQAHYREIWNVPGPFQGVGPSNYQRSDAAIQEEINEIFTWNGQIDSSEIEVQVQSGQVTLSGTVDRREEKYLAEDLASEVTGVQNIDNRIRVQTNDGVRMRSMGRENMWMEGRIQPGMRVAGVDGKRIGQVKETRADGFILDRTEGEDTFIPYRAVKRADGQIILHVHANEIDRQNWKPNA